MSINEIICNWISQVMRYLNILWQMIMNILQYDYQATYARPSEIITLDELEGGLGPGGFEIIDEIHPISTHFLEHKIISRKAYADDSSSDDDRETSITLPVMDSLHYLRYKDKYSNAVVIESKIKVSDKLKQGTSKM